MTEKKSSIFSACDIKENILLDFYATVYPKRRNSHIWKWLNRSYFYNNKIPLVFLYENRVIAHSGMIPFKVSLNGKIYTASWFIDFFVLPEFQKRGIGTMLTEKCMEFSDIYVAFCNDKSMGIFKKQGWVETHDTYYHRYLLTPYLRLARIRRIFNIFSILNYSKYSLGVRNTIFDCIESFRMFKTLPSENTVIPVRDYDYFKWRILNSPDTDRYRVFSIKHTDMNFIIKLCYNHIDILWVSEPKRYYVIRNMISTLALWGIKKGFLYIDFYTSDKALSSELLPMKPIITHPKFAFYTKDEALLETLKRSNWDWEVIDSDFEWI